MSFFKKINQIINETNCLHYCITLFRAITMLCGTDNIMWNTLHIHNIVLTLNNVMCSRTEIPRIFYKKKNTRIIENLHDPTVQAS